MKPRPIIVSGLLFPLVVASLIVMACAPAATPSADKGFAIGRPAAPAPAAPFIAREERGGAPALPSQERRIVLNVNMSLVVKDIQESLDKIAAIAGKYDGFVVSSSRQGQDGSSRGHITIRVASQQTDKALGELRALASRVESESSNAQDVTEEFIDLEARLKNLQATEEQFLAILQKATTVEDILKVQKELSNVRGEIERVKGRLQFLERTTTTSLISVELRPLASPEPLVRQSWSALETAKEALRGLSETAQGMASLLIWVVIFAPLWVPVIILAVLLRRVVRRRRARPAAIEPPAP